MNKVINGDYKGQGVTNSLYGAVITLPFFKTVKLSPKTVFRCEVKIGNSWIDISEFDVGKFRQKDYIIVITFRDGKMSALQVNSSICRTIKKAFAKENKSQKNGVSGKILLFFFLLVIDFYMIRMFPQNYTKASFWGALTVFFTFTVFLFSYIFINQYTKKKRWEIVSCNNEMNKSLRIDAYFENREKLVSMLTTLAKYELFISKGNGLTDNPSKILKELEENKELQIHSALIRMTSFGKDFIREHGAGFSRLFSEEIERHSHEMSKENLKDAKACLTILEQYESVVGTVAEVDSMEGHEFEYWCAELLKKNGFTEVEVTKGSGDQGVDVLAVKDGIRYAIQCKCYSSNLGNGPIQEVHAGKALYHCQVGVVMTNRHFTPGAKELATATGVLLWDRDKLEEMLTTAAP